jgi:hypothetical protein
MQNCAIENIYVLIIIFLIQLPLDIIIIHILLRGKSSGGK